MYAKLYQAFSTLFWVNHVETQPYELEPCFQQMFQSFHGNTIQFQEDMGFCLFRKHLGPIWQHTRERILNKSHYWTCMFGACYTGVASSLILVGAKEEGERPALSECLPINQPLYQHDQEKRKGYQHLYLATFFNI